MGYIDDATNPVFGRFYEYEGTMPAMDSFRQYVRAYGLPQSVYLDRHTTYKSTKKLMLAEELEGQSKPMSQFERALEELGVEVIHAYSPQAKGRIERLFGVFQDRLIKEMRLAGVKTKDGANDFPLKTTKQKQDISTLLKTGHFYFGLTTTHAPLDSIRIPLL